MKRSARPFFLKGLILSAVCAAVIFLLECQIAGLFPIVNLAVREPVLWICPLLAAAAVFLVFIPVKGKSLIWIIILGLMLYSEFYFMIHSDPLVRLSCWRDRQLALKTQMREPLVLNTLRLDTKVPVFVSEDENGQPAIGISQAQALEDLINSLKDPLLEQVTGIYFLDEDAYENPAETESGPTLGFTNLQNGVVMIHTFEDERFSSIDSSSLVKQLYLETIVHELIHTLDLQQSGAQLRFSQTAPWQKIYQKYQDALGSYASSSAAEFFAQAGSDYYLDPDQLRQQVPEAFDWFEERFKEASSPSDE